MKRKLFGLLALVLGAMSFPLQGFNALPGGDRYSIFVNNKLVLEHYVHAKGQPTRLSLEGYKDDDRLVVHYSHCGRIGLQRALQVKNGKGALLRQWQFSDEGAGMRLQVKDISRLSNGAPVYLYYTSRELKPAMMLATVSGGSTLAKK